VLTGATVGEAADEAAELDSAAEELEVAAAELDSAAEELEAAEELDAAELDEAAELEEAAEELEAAVLEAAVLEAALEVSSAPHAVQPLVSPLARVSWAETTEKPASRMAAVVLVKRITNEKLRRN
jgi:uncharacterized membrane protein YccC